MMEPMTLGSAPASPVSPGVGPNFLPNFLMGDTAQPAAVNFNTSPSRGRPGNLRRQASTPAAFPKYLNAPVAEGLQQFTPHKSGPPSQSLFDNIEPKRRPHTPALSSTVLNETPVSPGFGRSISRIGDDSLNFSKSTLNELHRSTFGAVDTQWVTVFGFPPSSLSMVLAQLTNCGTIVEKKMPPQGNWVHVKFANMSDVPRALALSGKCLNSCIMIGVTLYYNKENKENETNAYNTPVRARSLRQSFVSPSGSNTVIPAQNVPQKSTGLVSKAMEYVFGW